MKIVIFLLCNIIFNAAGNALIKQSMLNVNNSEMNGVIGFIKCFAMNPIFILGCAFYGISLLFYSLVLRVMNLNIAYPIVVSGSFIVVTVLSVLVFKESIKPTQYAGFLTIALGIYLVVK